MGETDMGAKPIVQLKTVTEKIPQEELEIFEPRCFGVIGFMTDTFKEKYEKMGGKVSKLASSFLELSSPEYIRALTVLKHWGPMVYYNWAVNAGLDPKTMETVVKDLVEEHRLVDRKWNSMLDKGYGMHEYGINERGLQVWEVAKILYGEVQKRTKK